MMGTGNGADESGAFNYLLCAQSVQLLMVGKTDLVPRCQRTFACDTERNKFMIFQSVNRNGTRFDLQTQIFRHRVHHTVDTVITVYA